MLHVCVGQHRTLQHGATKLHLLEPVTSSAAEAEEKGMEIIWNWLLRVTSTCSLLASPHHMVLLRVRMRLRGVKPLVTSKEAQALWVMQAQDWQWCDPESQQLLIFFILGNLLVSPLSWWWPHLTDRRLGNAVSLISGRER